MIHAMINNIPVEVADGMTILEAAEQYGIRIPTLCYMKELDPEGSCRICLVEIEGNPKLVTACSHPIAEGNVIHTDTERVIDARKSSLDLLLSNHDIDCFSCPGNGACELADLCYEYGVEKSSYATVEGELEEPVDDTNEFFIYNPNRCILCHRCVNTCNKIAGRGAISTTERGFRAIVSPAFGMAWKDTN